MSPIACDPMGLDKSLPESAEFIAIGEKMA
jgi:hypothetical protein